MKTSHDDPEGRERERGRGEEAEAYCEANGGAAPPGFVVVGDGPILGPKQ